MRKNQLLNASLVVHLNTGLINALNNKQDPNVSGAMNLDT